MVDMGGISMSTQLLELPIQKVTVVEGYMGPDRIIIWTSLPPPWPPITDQPLTLDFKAAVGTGVEYIRKNFGIEPEVICTTRGDHFVESRKNDDQSK